MWCRSQSFYFPAICNVCIARFDHHCSFLNICIGKHNNRYFVALLGSLVLMCGVSSFMIIMVFIHIVDTKRLHIAQYTDQHGMVYEASMQTVLQVLYFGINCFFFNQGRIHSWTLGGDFLFFHVRSFLTLLFAIGNIAIWGGHGPFPAPHWTRPCLQFICIDLLLL